MWTEYQFRGKNEQIWVWNTGEDLITAVKHDGKIHQQRAGPAEGGVGEPNQDRVDDVTHPHRPRSHTEVKEDTMTVNSKKGKTSKH